MLTREEVLLEIFNPEHLDKATLEEALEEIEFDVIFSYNNEDEIRRLTIEVSCRMLMILKDHC